MCAHIGYNTCGFKWEINCYRHSYRKESRAFNHTVLFSFYFSKFLLERYLIAIYTSPSSLYIIQMLHFRIDLFLLRPKNCLCLYLFVIDVTFPDFYSVLLFNLSIYVLLLSKFNVKIQSLRKFCFLFLKMLLDVQSPRLMSFNVHVNTRLPTNFELLLCIQ